MEQYIFTGAGILSDYFDSDDVLVTVVDVELFNLEENNLLVQDRTSKDKYLNIIED